MFEILSKKWLSEKICMMDIKADDLSKNAKPGHFVIVKAFKKSERIPLTICDYNRDKKSISLVFQVLGKSTLEMSVMEIGDRFEDVVGPLGQHSELLDENIDELKNKRHLFIGGGVGIAPIYPQLKWMSENKMDFDVILGARDSSLLILEEEIKKLTKNVYVCTDDGSKGLKGNVVALMDELIEKKRYNYDHIISIGPLVMMKFSSAKAKEYGIKTTVSLNPLMIDGTGMCGACRVSIGEKIKFACVDGPEFDGALVNFDEAIKRQNMYKTEEGRDFLEALDGETAHHPDCNCSKEDEDLEFNRWKAVPVKELSPEIRRGNFEEVNLGYDLSEAKLEASRCLDCKNAKCIEGCPVKIDIPGFIREIKAGDLKASAEILSKYTALPAVCGRVCPQESQCEQRCVVGIRGESVKIGRLERFIGDIMLENPVTPKKVEKKKEKIAVVGSGPAGLTAAGELAKIGYSVTVYEALHELGGVLTYGIPEFRLPKEKVVQREIENIKNMGVKFVTNYVIGKTATIEELLEEKGYSAVFIGSGAGLPRFMNIPGENLNGVVSANEFLTRVNLMRAHEEKYDTPVNLGKKTVIVGGGNVAMDAARTAIRLGIDTKIIYRRREQDLPARLEEVHHAKEEGVDFIFQTLPIEIVADEFSRVSGIKCIKTSVYDTGLKGRSEMVELPNTDFFRGVDSVIMSLGTSSNPIIVDNSGLETTSRNYIKVQGDTTKTSKEGVFAGGDIVIGAATVILAMEAGKKAAKEIDEYIKDKNINKN
ncbi:MAG: NADPH-dependent glutamate synthase [Fusobacteriaceae bacterium]